jgi:hypothetical protein
VAFFLECLAPIEFPGRVALGCCFVECPRGSLAGFHLARKPARRVNRLIRNAQQSYLSIVQIFQPDLSHERRVVGWWNGRKICRCTVAADTVSHD